MTQEQATAFLQALGCKKVSVKNQQWVMASCPLAQWLHEKGTDYTPSFGLSIGAGERSFFHCFSCRSGSAEELLQVIELYSKGGDKTGYNFTLAHQLLTEEVQILPLPDYGEYKKPEQVFVEWPQYWLDSFKAVGWFPAATEYLSSRGVTQDTITKHGLRFDSSREMIVCPYTNADGKLAGARGRSINPGVKGPDKHWDYKWNGNNNYRLVWYNEPVLYLFGSVVVVEGQFDCWAVEQIYPKVLANLTAKPSIEKLKKLGDCDSVIQIPDRDAAGEESVKSYASMCKKLKFKYKVLWLDEGVKDPAECHPEYLKDKIQELL